MTRINLNCCVKQLSEPSINAQIQSTFWDPFGSFSQWEVGHAPLYDSMNHIVGYTNDFVEYFISIWKHQLHHDGKSLLIGTGHISDFPNASTELLITPRNKMSYHRHKHRNDGWKKWL